MAAQQIGGVLAGQQDAKVGAATEVQLHHVLGQRKDPLHAGRQAAAHPRDGALGTAPGGAPFPAQQTPAATWEQLRLDACIKELFCGAHNAKQLQVLLRATGCDGAHQEALDQALVQVRRHVQQAHHPRENAPPSVVRIVCSQKKGVQRRDARALAAPRQRSVVQRVRRKLWPRAHHLEQRKRVEQQIGGHLHQAQRGLHAQSHHVAQPGEKAQLRRKQPRQRPGAPLLHQAHVPHVHKVEHRAARVSAPNPQPRVQVLDGAASNRYKDIEVIKVLQALHVQVHFSTHEAGAHNLCLAIRVCDPKDVLVHIQKGEAGHVGRANALASSALQCLSVAQVLPGVHPPHAHALIRAAN